MESSFHYLMMVNHLRFYKSAYSKLEGTGLTFGQPKVLEYICIHSGCLQKDIAKGYCIEPATVTSLLLRMEAQGLITRVCDNDKRSHRVFPTEKGVAMNQLICQAFKDTEKLAFNGFSEEEILLFSQMQKRINENLCNISDKKQITEERKKKR
ncbi:MAG: MarR family transcriptional regulator [Oscillospiraceae bacterium]|nr:MarR family transcriptional regulator [Oscillospiraceae bacterium]